MQTKKQSGNILVIVLVAMVVLVGGAVGVSFMSRDANPGDPLYDVRVLNEGIKYSLTPTATARAELALNISQTTDGQIREAVGKPGISADDLKGAMAVLTSNIQKATDAAKEAKPASFAGGNIPGAVDKVASKPSTDADSVKYAQLVGNMINKTQSATTTLQQTALKVPAAASDSKEAIKQLQTNLQQQATTLQTSAGSTSSGHSTTTNTCFSSITTQKNGQPPVSQTSSSCNSVLTSSSTSTSQPATPVKPVTGTCSTKECPNQNNPPKPEGTNTSTSTSKCHSISTQTINGVTTTKESFSCNTSTTQKP